MLGKATTSRNQKRSEELTETSLEETAQKIKSFTQKWTTANQHTPYQSRLTASMLDVAQYPLPEGACDMDDTTLLALWVSKFGAEWHRELDASEELEEDKMLYAVTLVLLSRRYLVRREDDANGPVFGISPRGRVLLYGEEATHGNP